jgi:hypothetical protein
MDEFIQNLSADGIDKTKEYFKIKKALKDLRNDIKDLTTQHEDYEESQKLAKKLKELRDRIKSDEKIKELSERSPVLKERGELLKEMIRIELIENAMEEVKSEGKKLKLVYVLKELRDDEKK